MTESQRFSAGVSSEKINIEVKKNDPHNSARVFPTFP